MQLPRIETALVLSVPSVVLKGASIPSCVGVWVVEVSSGGNLWVPESTQQGTLVLAVSIRSQLANLAHASWPWDEGRLLRFRQSCL